MVIFLSPPQGETRDGDCEGAAGGLAEDGGGGGGGGGVRFLLAPATIPPWLEEGKGVEEALPAISDDFFKRFVFILVPLPLTLSADLLAEGMGPP